MGAWALPKPMSPTEMASSRRHIFSWNWGLVMYIS